jgi:hypothetical protein
MLSRLSPQPFPFFQSIFKRATPGEVTLGEVTLRISLLIARNGPSNLDPGPGIMALTWGGSRCRIKAPGSLVFPLVTAAGDLHHCQGLTADVTFSPPSTGANVRSKGKPFACVFLSWQKVVTPRLVGSTLAGSPPWFQHLYQSQVTVPWEEWNETDVVSATVLRSHRLS